MSLKKHRKSLGKIDSELCLLLLQRQEVVNRIKKSKKKSKIDSFSPNEYERKKEFFNTMLGGDGIEIYNLLHTQSLKIQNE